MLSNVTYAVMGMVATTFEVISMTVCEGPLSVVVVMEFPSKSVVVIVCMSSYVEVDSTTVWLVLKLFDTVGAVIVVTTACVDTGTAGYAREVEIWRSSKPSRDKDENMLARRANAHTTPCHATSSNAKHAKKGCRRPARRQVVGTCGTYTEPRFDKGVGPGRASSLKPRVQRLGHGQGTSFSVGL